MYWELASSDCCCSPGKRKYPYPHLDLIAGLPYEDMEASAIHSFNEVYACRPEQLQLGFWVLKGSYMHEKASEYEIHYTDKPPYEVLLPTGCPMTRY